MVARIALVLLMLLPSLAQAGEEGTIVAGRGVGPARLGAAVSSLVPAWGPGRRRLAEEKDPGTRAPRYYYEYPEHGLWLLVQEGRILKIGVEGGTWKTSRGATLWMRVEEVQRLYGRGRKRRPEGWDPEKPPEYPRYFLEYPSQGIDFLIQEKSLVVEAIHVYPPRAR